MGAYSSILQVFAILIVVFIIFSFFRILVSVKRSKRIEEFAISSNNENLSFEQRLYKIIYWTSDFINEMVIFNGLAGAYEKYVAMGDNKFKKGIDFIALKTILGFVSMLMYLIWALIFDVGIGLILSVLSFVVGSIIPDIYYRLKYYKNNTDIVDDLLRAVIIINNSFRANRSVEQALNDVIARLNGPLKREFLKVKNDLRLGIDLGFAFRRMYERTKISTIYDIANKMDLIGEQGVNIVKVFENIEKDILEEEKIRNDVKTLSKFNSMLYYFLLVFPVAILAWVIVTNENIFKYVVGDGAFIYAIIFTIIYIMYVVSMRKLVKVIYYER